MTMLISDYRVFVEITTRWMDNDVYGHVNNVVYYSFFDTAVNRWLIEQGVLDIHGGAVVGFVVETSCTYERPIAFPDRVRAGIRVAKIGRTPPRELTALPVGGRQSKRWSVGARRPPAFHGFAHGAHMPFETTCAPSSIHASICASSAAGIERNERPIR